MAVDWIRLPSIKIKSEVELKKLPCQLAIE